jgi:hypothetical protein
VSGLSATGGGAMIMVAHAYTQAFSMLLLSQLEFVPGIGRARMVCGAQSVWVATLSYLLVRPNMFKLPWSICVDSLEMSLTCMFE